MAKRVLTKTNLMGIFLPCVTNGSLTKWAPGVVGAVQWGGGVPGLKPTAPKPCCGDICGDGANARLNYESLQ